MSNGVYIYLKLKDPCVSHYITGQKISLVGIRPTKVKKNDYVRALIKNGTAEEASEEEFLQFKKDQMNLKEKADLANAKVLKNANKFHKEAIEKGRAMLLAGEIEQSEAYLDVANLHKPDSKDCKALLNAILEAKDEIAKDVDDAANAVIQKKAAIKVLLTDAVKAKVIEKKPEGYFLNDLNLGDKEPSVIDKIYADEQLVIKIKGFLKS